MYSISKYIMQNIVNMYHLLSSNISNTFNIIVMMEITLNCVDNVTIQLKINILSVVRTASTLCK